MLRYRHFGFCLTLCCSGCTAATSVVHEASSNETSSEDRSIQRANETHDFVVGTLLTPSGSYRTTRAEDITDEWHDASQVGADVAMVALGDTRYVPYIERTYGFMGQFWDTSSPLGGYAPRARIDGTGVESATKFLDDNALTAVTWLDARAVVSDRGSQDAFLGSAVAVANFMMWSGVWDDVYGGGFWWNTDKPDKPTQTNGLALQLFLRLSALTGETYYRDWAANILGWLDGKMFDAADGLYSWKWEATGRNDTKFTYDQAILIEAHVVLFEQTGDPVYLEKARALAAALDAKLWAEPGGYLISTEDRRLSPVFSAWASCALARLYGVDRDERWLTRARQNVDALDRHLRDASTHGYYATVNPDGSARSDDQQEVDQAWMQRAHAMIARASRR